MFDILEDFLKNSYKHKKYKHSPKYHDVYDESYFEKKRPHFNSEHLPLNFESMLLNKIKSYKNILFIGSLSLAIIAFFGISILVAIIAFVIVPIAGLIFAQLPEFGNILEYFSNNYSSLFGIFFPEEKQQIEQLQTQFEAIQQIGN